MLRELGGRRGRAGGAGHMNFAPGRSAWETEVDGTADAGGAVYCLRAGFCAAVKTAAAHIPSLSSLLGQAVATLIGIVADRRDVVFAEGEAAHVAGEIDEFLQGHAVWRSFVVGGEELFFVVDLVDVLPAAAGIGLEDGGATNVIEEAVPIDGIIEIVQGFGGDVDVGGIAFLWEEDSLRNGNAQFRGDGVVEKLVVGGQGIVDDVRALQNGVLEIAAVVFDFVGDAVDDYGVFGGLVHARAAELDEFGGDSVGFAKLVHPDDERRRETVFTAAEKANLLHSELLMQTPDAY